MAAQNARLPLQAVAAAIEAGLPASAAAMYQGWPAPPPAEALLAALLLDRRADLPGLLAAADAAGMA
ncbi:MAG: hypothetical protein B7Z52_03690, partial [Burkholderiales bacterium 12-64-5]